MKDASKDEVLNISKEIASLAEEKKTCLSEKITLSGELERIKNWGEINPEIIAELKCKGVEVAFYEMPKTEYDTLSEAAIIAAHYSKAKNNSKVPVDYTEIKNLRKPNGAKPGMVIYYTNKTIYVDPEKFNTLNILKKQGCDHIPFLTYRRLKTF